MDTPCWTRRYESHNEISHVPSAYVDLQVVHEPVVEIDVEPLSSLISNVYGVIVELNSQVFSSHSQIPMAPYRQT